MSSAKNESKLEIFMRHVASLQNDLAKLKEYQIILANRRVTDHMKICNQYEELSGCIEVSKIRSLKKCDEMYTAKIYDIKKSYDDTERRLIDAQELRGVTTIPTKLPDVNFEARLDISLIKNMIVGLQVEETIKDLDAVVKDEINVQIIKKEPGSGEGGAEELLVEPSSTSNPISVQSCSQVQVPTAKEANQCLHNNDNPRYSEQDGSSEGECGGHASPMKKLKKSTGGDDDIVSKQPGDKKVVSIQTKNKVRDYIECKKCHMRRCVYSDTKLTEEQAQLWRKQKKKLLLSYNCAGGLNFSTSCDLKNILQAEDKCECNKVISAHYYTPAKKFPEVCYICASEAKLTKVSKWEKESYAFYHPVCNRCEKSGKTPRSRRNVKPGDQKQVVETYSVNTKVNVYKLLLGETSSKKA